jgi:hypothetical protein
MTKKLYTLTNEHKAKIPEHNEKWKKITLDTKRLSLEDKQLCIDSVNKIYELAKLEKPKTIMFVSSPLVLVFVGGLARFILNEKSKDKDRSATDSATRSATYSATDSATDSATRSATDSATYSATSSAIDSATDSATYSATISATDSATYSATISAIDSATYSATSSAIDSATDSATYSATISATDSATYSATISATDSATYSATISAIDSATYSATYSATDSATYSATSSATDSATRSATDSATRSATYSATRSATYSATDSATRSATDSATRSATYSATRSATYSATDSATRYATYSATRSTTDSTTISATDDATKSAIYSATRSATRSATDDATISNPTVDIKTENFEIAPGIVCHENFWNEVRQILANLNMSDKFDDAVKYIRGVNSIWQGGCNWAQYDCFLSFFQDVVGLDVDYSVYKPYKDLTVAGYRILDRDFAMISEKPVSIRMKDNLSHNLEGPAIEYMDGSKLYMAYGNLIPSWIVTTSKAAITKEMILGEKNADFRRYLIERIGIERYISILGTAKTLDTFESRVGGKYELIQVNINNEKCVYLKMLNQSEFVWHFEGVPADVRTCKAAICFRNGMKTFVEPKFLS